MDQIDNQLSRMQSNDECKQYLAACCYFTAKVKRLAETRLIVTVLLPGLLSLSAIFFQWMRVWAALYGVVISLIDVSLIERKLQEGKIDSAKIQECFDCNIFNIAWNEIKVGGKPEREKISSASDRYKPKGDEFKDWFPPLIGVLPQRLTWIVCLRTSTWWPTQVRRLYLSCLQGVFIALIISIIIIGVATRVSLETLILAVLTPLSPTMLWFVREIRKQKETTAKLEGLISKIEDIWDKALKRELKDGQLEEKARQFQDETYDFRCTYQPINSYVYRRLRKGLPKRMQVTVEEMVREALRTLKTGSDEALIEAIINGYKELPSQRQDQV
jgi:SMODS-associating 4TM effector domain